jgi:hypothetical protein
MRSLSLESAMSAVLTVRIPEIEKAAIERAAAISGRWQSSSGRPCDSRDT